MNPRISLRRPLAVAAVAATTAAVSLTTMATAQAAGTTTTLSFVAGTGAAGAPHAGAATKSRLHAPSGVAVDKSGDVYIADTTNNRVEKVTPAGRLSVVAGTGAAGAPTAGTATRSRLSAPRGVAVDALGNLYIADTGNNRVEKVTPKGQLSILAGTGTTGAPDPGPAASSNLDAPGGVAVDAAGNVYVADSDNNRIEKIDSTGTLSVVVGTGIAGTPTPGPATASRLDEPSGVATGPSGALYIADTYNNEVEKVGTDGTLSVLAGKGPASPGRPTRGAATASRLNSPTSVAIAGGVVHVADSRNHEVEAITSGGTLSIVAGTGTQGKPTAGTATASRLGVVSGVAASGNAVYVADTSNNRVEKVLTLAAGVGKLSGSVPRPALRKAKAGYRSATFTLKSVKAPAGYQASLQVETGHSWAYRGRSNVVRLAAKADGGTRVKATYRWVFRSATKSMHGPTRALSAATKRATIAFSYQKNLTGTFRFSGFGKGRRPVTVTTSYRGRSYAKRYQVSIAKSGKGTLRHVLLGSHGLRFKVALGHITKSFRTP